MDRAEIRRARLREWFSERPVPANEKSYLSQLMTGRASFGEKAARRLERDYGMPLNYLDAPQEDMAPPVASSLPDALRAAWEKLLPDLQKEMLALITEKADYSESVRAQVLAEQSAKSETKTVKVGGKVKFFTGPERREQQRPFSHADWRKK